MNIKENEVKVLIDETLCPGDGNKQSLINAVRFEKIVAQIHINRSAERIRRNKTLSILYKLEYYLYNGVSKFT